MLNFNHCNMNLRKLMSYSLITLLLAGFTTSCNSSKETAEATPRQENWQEVGEVYEDRNISELSNDQLLSLAEETINTFEEKADQVKVSGELVDLEEEFQELQRLQSEKEKLKDMVNEIDGFLGIGEDWNGQRPNLEEELQSFRNEANDFLEDKQI